MGLGLSCSHSRVECPSHKRNFLSDLLLMVYLIKKVHKVSVVKLVWSGFLSHSSGNRSLRETTPWVNMSIHLLRLAEGQQQPLQTKPYLNLCAFIDFLCVFIENVQAF